MTKSGRSLFWTEKARFAALFEQIEEETPTPAQLAAAPMPQMAAPATMVLSAPEIVPRPLELPAGSIETRLQALIDWVRDTTGCEEAFVADREGLALVELNSRPELVASMSAVGERWDAVRRSWDAVAGRSMRIDLDDGQQLYLLPADSRWGRLHLGFCTERQLTRTILGRVSEMFELSLDDTAGKDKEQSGS